MSGLKLSWSDVTSFLLEIYIHFWFSSDLWNKDFKTDTMQILCKLCAKAIEDHDIWDIAETTWRYVTLKLHSTNIAIANKYASTSHVHAKLRKRDKVNMKTSFTPNEQADSAKNKHQEYVWALKETLKSSETNRIYTGSADIITISLDANFKIFQEFSKVP